MKPILLLLLAFLLSSVQLYAQDAAAAVEAISEAFTEGDARKLSNHFGPTLVIELPSKMSSYSKSQAQMIIRDFFATNKPEKFTVDHQGENRDSSRFLIATLDSKKKRFRVYLVMKQQKTDYLIHHLNISQYEQ